MLWLGYYSAGVVVWIGSTDPLLTLQILICPVPVLLRMWTATSPLFPCLVT